jgi:hypothetical protein
MTIGNVDNRQQYQNVLPLFTMPDIISPDLWRWLVVNARLFPSILGGTVSLIFRDWGCVVWETLVDVDMGVALQTFGVRGAACNFEQVQSPSQIGHMWSSSSSSTVGGLEVKFRPTAAPTVWG